jgi:hypothetical protein
LNTQKPAEGKEKKKKKETSCRVISAFSFSQNPRFIRGIAQCKHIGSALYLRISFSSDLDVKDLILID